MSFEYTFETNPEEKSNICANILNALPLWFGIPESNQKYCQGVRQHPFLKVSTHGQTIGFISLKHNTEFCLEIYVMGIAPHYHRQGLGKALLEKTKSYAQSEGYRYLEVKTLDQSAESEEYKKTRLFYRHAGFMPIDVLLNEWGSHNPCLLMLMPLASRPLFNRQ